MSFRIRDIVLPQEKAAALSFIDGSQRYEHRIEPNRRLDDAVAAEHFTLLRERWRQTRDACSSPNRISASLAGRSSSWKITPSSSMRSSGPTATSPNSS